MERPRTEHTRYALLPHPAPAGAHRHRLLPRARGWPGGLARAHRAAHRPVTARPRARACPLSRTTAGRRHTRPGCPLLQLPNLPPAHLPLALPRASDWVPVGRRWARPAAQLRNALGWVGRARIFVWSVPAGASGLPPEAAALFLSLSAASLPFSVVAAPPVEDADGLSRPGVAELGWVGLDGSGRRWLGRKGGHEMGEGRHRRSQRRGLCECFCPRRRCWRCGHTHCRCPPERRRP